MNNIANIKKLTLDDKFFDVLYRLVDFSLIDNNLPQYDLDKDMSLSMYDRLLINVQVVKPTLLEMEAELSILKSKLISEEQARLDELARIKDLELRFDALEDIHLIAQAAGVHQPNMAIKRRDIIRDNDVATLILLEKEDKLNKSKKAAELAAKPMKELRIKRDKLLKDSDFSQMADVPLTTLQKQEYQAYRKYLRELPGKITLGTVLMQPAKTFSEYKASLI